MAEAPPAPPRGEPPGGVIAETVVPICVAYFAVAFALTRLFPVIGG